MSKTTYCWSIILLVMFVITVVLFINLNTQLTTLEIDEFQLINSCSTMSKENINEYHPPLDIPETTEETLEHILMQEPPDSKSSSYSITTEEREMLARLAYLEAGICSFECKVAVISVVFNRLDSEKWTKDMNNDGTISLYDIIYYPNAFTPCRLIPETSPTQSCYDAVDHVLQYGSVFPNGVRYFRINYDFQWEDYKNYCTIDNVYFGYFIGWEDGGW